MRIEIISKTIFMRAIWVKNSTAMWTQKTYSGLIPNNFYNKYAIGTMLKSIVPSTN